jgi:hypothetical protein
MPSPSCMRGRAEGKPKGPETQLTKSKESHLKISDIAQNLSERALTPKGRKRRKIFHGYQRSQVRELQRRLRVE